MSVATVIKSLAQDAGLSLVFGAAVGGVIGTALYFGEPQKRLAEREYPSITHEDAGRLDRDAAIVAGVAVAGAVFVKGRRLRAEP